MAQERNKNRDLDEQAGNAAPQSTPENEERFESDTQRIIHRHLENKDDVITEEDIRNVRIGMTPQLDEATEARFEDEDRVDEVEDELTEGTSDAEPERREDDRVTPWDTIDPK